MNQKIARENIKKDKEIAYFPILFFILAPSIILSVVSVCAIENTDITLNPAEAQDVWALVIGISDYGDAEKNLHGASVNSAKMINSTLIDIFGWSISHIRLLLDVESQVNDDVTKKEIQDGIDWLAMREKQNDTVLFYFSGHGSRDQSGEPEFLALNEAQSYSDFLSDDELASMLSQLQSNRVIVILDNCFSGGFAWDGTDKGDLAREGRIILTSCREDEYSYASGLQGGTDWKQRFTSYLVEGLVDGKTVEGAFHYASETITQTFQFVTVQHPQMYDGVNPITKSSPDVTLIVFGTVIPIAALAIVLFLMSNKRKPTAAQPGIVPSAYFCPVCNKSLVWMPQHQKLYCPNCKRQIA